MIDSHTHLNLSPLLEEWSTIWKSAQQAGVTKALCIGTDLATSKQAVELASKDPCIYAAVGLHPDEAEKGVADLQALESLCENDRVVAIGECGLDYVGLQGKGEEDIHKGKTIQKRVFGEQIQIAKRHHLPLSIHCRNTPKTGDSSDPLLDAYHDLLDTLRHFCVDDGVIPPFVLHCMSGSVEYLQEALPMGAYVSFAGNVTYPSATAIRELLHATPLDRLLVETDAPFLSPQGKRGTVNTPANVMDTAAFIAKELHMSLEEIDQLTTANARKLFKLT